VGTNSGAGVARSGETGGFPHAGEFRLEMHQEKAYRAHTD
jgi:hypothetical protein